MSANLLNMGYNIAKGVQGTFLAMNSKGQNTTSPNGHTIPTAVQPVQQQSTTTTDPNAFAATMMRGQMMQQTLGMAFQGLGQLGSIFDNAGGRKNKKKDGDEDTQVADNRKPNRREVQETWQRNSSGCTNGQCQT